MTDPLTPRPIVLDHLPTATFGVAVQYLNDVLRECQLILVSRSQGRPGDEVLSSLADGLVPDLEEVRDAFRAAEVTTNADGSTRLVGSAPGSFVATVADLQVQLIQIRILGRRGGLMVESDPQATQLLAWVWDEIADQLHGRPPRPYQPAS